MNEKTNRKEVCERCGTDLKKLTSLIFIKGTAYINNVGVPTKNMFFCLPCWQKLVESHFAMEKNEGY